MILLAGLVGVFIGQEYSKICNEREKIRRFGQCHFPFLYGIPGAEVGEVGAAAGVIPPLVTRMKGDIKYQKTLQIRTPP